MSSERHSVTYGTVTENTGSGARLPGTKLSLG